MKSDWQKLLQNEMEQVYFRNLWQYVEDSYQKSDIYPIKSDIFTALELTGYSETKVVILGQDPYHGQNQAHGLSFSVACDSAKFPPSLRNIFKELESDLGIIRTQRNLTDWAQQGVLLLNTVLTVSAGQAASHRGKGWEQFTDAIIRLLNQRQHPIIFVLWGADAQKKTPLLTGSQHKVIQSAHPSPLSAHRGFFGSKPFSQINTCLEKWHQPAIVWGNTLT